MEIKSVAPRFLRAEQRRQEILQAAARVFAQKGFEKSTTREIAQEAGVAEGTIYTHFASKQQLLTALVATVQAQFDAIRLRLQASGAAPADIVAMVEGVLATLAEQGEVIRGLLTALWDQRGSFQGYLFPGSQEVMLSIEEYLRAGIQAGVLRRCDVRLVARMAVGSILFQALPHMRGLEPVPTLQQRHLDAELLVSILLDGLRVREAPPCGRD